MSLKICVKYYSSIWRADSGQEWQRQAVSRPQALRPWQP